MAIIGVDVDLTVVRSDLGWFDWCNSISKHQHTLETFSEKGELVPYNFESLYPDLSSEEIMHYWRRRDLYDNLSPIEGSQNALCELSQEHKIVFVSTLKGDHHKSKYQFLERNFPFLSGFIGTKEKEFARIDMLIDDRISVLNRLVCTDIIPVQFKTPYSQAEQAPFQYTSVIDGWNDTSVSLIKSLI